MAKHIKLFSYILVMSLWSSEIGFNYLMLVSRMWGNSLDVYFSTLFHMLERL